MTDPLTLGIVALVVLVALIAIRIPIAYAMTKAWTRTSCNLGEIPDHMASLKLEGMVR